MPLSPLPQSERPWSNAVHTAYQKLYQIYHTGSSYIDVGNIEAHRVQQYGNAIITDAYPILLLLTESAAAESVPLQWIEELATQFTTLLQLIEEQWVSVKDEYVSCIMADIDLTAWFSDRQAMSTSLSLSIQHALGNVADLKNALILRSSMRLFRKGGRFLSLSLQVF